MTEFIKKSIESLGTNIDICIPKENENLLEICFNEIKRIDNTFSRFKKGNELHELNSNLNKWQSVSNEMLFLLKYAIKIKRKTSGYIDITIKKFLEDIGYDENYSFEEKHDIEDFSLGEINTRSDGKVKITREVEFGSFGKGYAIDRLVEFLENNRVNSFFINAGGDIYVHGYPSLDTNWKIHLENPIDLTSVIGEIEMEGESLASSSSNRRSWGKHSHLINPKTGESMSNVLGCFVKGEKAIETDALSTAIFVMGFDKAKEFVQKKKISALIISDGGDVFKSKSFNAKLYTNS